MTVQYDPFSDDVIHGDNHGIYKRLRDESPMHYLEAYDAFALSRSIAAKVEEEMTFPGEIKVTVLREVRAEAVAR